MGRTDRSGQSVATIGVYGFDRDSFLTALTGANIDLLVDVRQRRGVRGSQYAWANSQRLQASLEETGIDYAHLKELAPTTEFRRLQYREDAKRGEGKRSRTVLAPEFARLYIERILNQVDLGPVVELVGERPAALLCVERDPEACHRSLIADRLQSDWGFDVEHLRPD